jgi:hypothetical protein
MRLCELQELRSVAGRGGERSNKTQLLAVAEIDRRRRDLDFDPADLIDGERKKPLKSLSQAFPMPNLLQRATEMFLIPPLCFADDELELYL